MKFENIKNLKVNPIKEIGDINLYNITFDATIREGEFIENKYEVLVGCPRCTLNLENTINQLQLTFETMATPENIKSYKVKLKNK